MLTLYAINRFVLLGYYLFDPMRTTLALELETDNCTMFINWLNLPDRNRNYTLEIPAIGRPKLINLGIVGILRLDTSQWIIRNTVTGELVKSPSWKILSPYKTRKLRQTIFRSRFEIHTVVIHSHHIETVPTTAV